MLKVYKRAFIEIIIKRYRVLNICSAIELKKSKGYFNIYITVEIWKEKKIENFFFNISDKCKLRLFLNQDYLNLEKLWYLKQFDKCSLQIICLIKIIAWKIRKLYWKIKGDKTSICIRKIIKFFIKKVNKLVIRFYEIYIIYKTDIK